MISGLGQALLGLLAREPATGYDLTRAMDRDLAYFWSARHSQVYPELAKLEAGGQVRHTVVAGAGPRPTKRYEITPEGKALLLEWIVTEPEQTVERDPVLLRISSLWLVDPAAAHAVVGGVRRRSTARLELYQRFAAEFDSRDETQDPGSPDFATRATLEVGIRYHQGRLDWCDWIDGRLDAGR